MPRSTSVTEGVKNLRSKFPNMKQRTFAAHVKRADFIDFRDRAEASRLHMVPLATIYGAVRRYDAAQKVESGTVLI